jgi:cytochrome b involved in lipid metabolism
MISIFGAGIAGLTCALELVEKGFNITIYEKDNLPGGMAKSKRINDGIPSEHSWRGVAPFYYNFFNLLKRIPINTIDTIEIFDNQYTSEEVVKHNNINDAWIIYKNNVYDITKFISLHPGGKVILKSLGKDIEKVWQENKVSWHNNSNIINILNKYKIGSVINEKFINLKNNTAYDNLSDGVHFILCNNNITKKKINKYELKYIFFDYIKFILGNNRSKKYYSEPFIDYFKNTKTKFNKDFILNFLLGPGIGLDKNNASSGIVFHFYSLYLKNKSQWSVMKKPTSEAFIDPLVTLLINKGVKFIYNSELIKINYENNIINTCDVKINNNIVNIKSDEFIIAINPNNCYNIFSLSNMNDLALLHENLQTTNNQISFRLGFNKKINYRMNNIAFVLNDSEFDITFYPQENYFNVPLDNNNNIKSLWSGTCCQSHSAIYFTKENLINEIINQILVSNDFQEIEIYPYNGYKINKEDIVYSEIYDEWKYIDNTLVADNKKWVNTIYNESFKPTNYTNYLNLYLAGAHTDTSIKIWSMEAACESGKLTSNLILNKYNINNIIVYKQKSISLFQKFDDLLYNYNLPNILYFIIFFIILLIYFIIKKILI